MRTDETHDPRRKSWVESANAEGCEFPVQNLPFGIFRRKASKEAPRAGSRRSTRSPPPAARRGRR